MTFLFGTLFRISVIAPVTLLSVLFLFSLMIIFKPTRWYCIGTLVAFLFV
ncbi:hypothetical protein [Peribacillus simplex]